MNLNHFFKLFLFTSILFVSSCRKEFIQTESPILTNKQLLKTHNSKVETWIKLIPIGGQIKAGTKISTKTIYNSGNFYTRMEIGDNGSSLLFINNGDLFHVYGMSTKHLSSDGNGIVDIFDFQSMEKKGLRFSNKKLSAIQVYAKETVFNAYEGNYQINNNSPNSTIILSGNTALSSASSPNLINSLRKFFCQLFGGLWTVAPYSLDSPTQYCAVGGGPDVVQEMQPPDYGGGNLSIWGLIYANINNINFFDFSSAMWNTIISDLNAGGISNNWLITTPVSFIDQECADPDKIRGLFYALNTYYNQQPSSLEYETIEETLDQYKLFKNQKQVALPIIPMLIKAGANGATDALTQAAFIYLTEDDCPSFGAAFGHDKFSGFQVFRSFGEGLFFWRTPGGKLGKGAFTAIGDVVVNLLDGKYGIDDYEEMGMDFMLGFFSDLAGGAAGELASKYSLGKIGKGLIKKCDLNYKMVTGWLGGGLSQINKTFNHTLSNGQTIAITANKVIKGWDPKKIAVIGRSQDDRVVPFANKLANELGIPVHQIKEWSGWNTNLTVDQNK